MLRGRRWYAVIVVFVMAGLVMLACGSLGGGETPTPTRVPPPAETPAGPGSGSGEGRCGDGVCDEMEQQNPALCPQDCATPGAESRGWCGDGVCDEAEQRTPGLCAQDCPGAVGAPTPCATPGAGGPSAGEVEDWWLVVDCCTDMVNVEPSAHICLRLEACITVDESGNISGSGTAHYDPNTCAYSSDACSYEVTCPDAPFTVSGTQVGDELCIMIDTMQIREQVTLNCMGMAQSYEGMMASSAFCCTYQLNDEECMLRVRAEDGAHSEVAGADPLVAEYLFCDCAVDLYEDCGGH